VHAKNSQIHKFSQAYESRLAAQCGSGTTCPRRGRPGRPGASGAGLELMPGGAVAAARLSQTLRCLASSPAVLLPLATASTSSPAPPPRLLSDDQVKTFIQDGYLLLPVSELSPGFHASLSSTAVAYNERQSRLGAESKDMNREYFLELPQLQQVIGGPTLRGAMTSLLGANYVQHPHRTMHTSADPGFGSDQDWHKDGHHVPVRHHFPRWVICFYYPQSTTLAMGPTAVMPRGQYFTTDRQDATGSAVAGNWADDRLVRMHADPYRFSSLGVYSGDDLGKRDARLAEDIAHLGIDPRPPSPAHLCHPA
jgi:hypothetical protein